MKCFFHLRGATQADVNYLVDIDLKSFDNPWSPEEWKALGNSEEHGISVVTNFGVPFGFAVFRRHDLDSRRGVQLLRLGVKPVARGKGVSRMLLESVKGYCGARHCECLWTIVPESTIYPGPFNLSNWLTKFGFKPVLPFIPNHYTVMGEPENGVQFVLNLGDKT